MLENQEVFISVEHVKPKKKWEPVIMISYDDRKSWVEHNGGPVPSGATHARVLYRKKPKPAFVLPEHWYTPNCPEATEWAEALCTCDPSNKDAGEFSFVYNHDGTCKSDWGNKRKHTQITKQQFIDHVYLPWKASQEEHRY